MNWIPRYNLQKGMYSRILTTTEWESITVLILYNNIIKLRYKVSYFQRNFQQQMVCFIYNNIIYLFYKNNLTTTVECILILKNIFILNYNIKST